MPLSTLKKKAGKREEERREEKKNARWKKQEGIMISLGGGNINMTEGSFDGEREREKAM